MGVEKNKNGLKEDFLDGKVLNYISFYVLYFYEILVYIKGDGEERA